MIQMLPTNYEPKSTLLVLVSTGHKCSSSIVDDCHYVNVYVLKDKKLVIFRRETQRWNELTALLAIAARSS